MQILFYQRLIQVLAIVSYSSLHSVEKEAESYILRFLLPLLGKDKKVLILDDFKSELEYFNGNLSEKRIAANSVKLMKFAQALKTEMNTLERRLLMIRVWEFVSDLSNTDKQIFQYLDLLRDMLEVSEHEVDTIIEACHDKRNVVFFMFDVQTVFCRINQVENFTNADKYPYQLIFPFYPSDYLCLTDGKVVDYSEARILSGFCKESYRLDIENLNVSLSQGKNLFHGLNVSVSSPGMLAVLGGSGVGKSSFLKLLSGVLKPKAESLFCTKSALSIAMMPQEDNIIAEQSLLKQLQGINKKYAYKKSLSDLYAIIDSVGLQGKENFIPGNVENSLLSGGERKRAGLACVLMSDPDLLLCDEPLSGLSSQDAEDLIFTLRASANSGRLVIASLHQPEKSVLKYFERILYLDEGGNAVFFGFVDEFYAYVSQQTGKKQPDVGLVKNLQSDLSKTEALIRLKDEFGKRKYSPDFWRERFHVYQAKQPKIKDTEKKYPFRYLHRKLRLFPAFVEDLSSVFSRKGFAVLSVLYAPVMAVLLAWVSRYSSGETYQAMQNIHLPVFFLMSVVVAIFGGLVLSVSEIGRLQAVRKREILQEGNHRRFFVVKLLRFVLFSLFHALMFSVVSMLILGLKYLIPSMAIMYFLLMMLFALVGMIISVLARRKSWAFVIIPILIIPQLVFSGGLIRWGDFNAWNRADKAPLFSRLIPASYAFETLMIESIVQNPEFSMDEERIYYLSLLYLQDIIPDYKKNISVMDTASLNSALVYSLPDELKPVFASSCDIDALQQVFATNFHSDFPETHHLPVVWRHLQNYDRLNRIDWSGKRVFAEQFAFYQTGTWRYDKSAMVSFLGITMPHRVMAWLVLLMMALLLLAFLWFYPFKWPY